MKLYNINAKKSCNHIFRKMFGDLLRVYFVLSFLYSGIYAQGDVFDNSVLTPTTNDNISSCICPDGAFRCL